ncbi:PREDICTED: calretinin-like [Gekko japonicus]|uniref:Calretinin-like n=1 Tax=Gekko japonicus TaxID=146911 RepID=A0ABM1LF81_GEKJA|nr:PREDICTED: calretinin-like [Gekko japonicus]
MRQPSHGFHVEVSGVDGGAVRCCSRGQQGDAQRCIEAEQRGAALGVSGAMLGARERCRERRFSKMRDAGGGGKFSTTAHGQGRSSTESKNVNFAEKMKEFMRKYDKNADGRIELSELAQILPTEENFLLCFRQDVGSSAEFMEAWRKYDTDRSGYIEANELQGFLSDLLEKANKPYEEPKLQEYTQTILRMFDLNGDGKLCLSEMSRLLPVQENFLLKFQGVKLDVEEFNAIFAFYDKDGNGFIDENELDALLKDLYEKDKKEMTIQQLTSYRRSIMNLSDGGKLYRKELEIVLCNEPPM